MNRLLELYAKTGRLGNILLLVMLVVFGFVSRVYVVGKHFYADYVIEMAVIALAGILVYRIFRKGTVILKDAKLFRTLLMIGLGLRILFAAHDMMNRPVQDSDYEKHEKLGQRMAIEGRFYDFAGVELRNFRQPGLPAMFAIGLLIYNHPVTYSLIMILFSFGVLLSSYYLFRNYRNIGALIAFAYVSLSPNMLFMASNSNTQLSFFFFLILLFIAMKYYTGKFYQLVIIGALLAAEMYIRFNFIMIGLMIPFLLEKHRDREFTFAMGRIAVMLGVCLLCYSPWIYRNYTIYGTIRLMPTTGLGLYSSNVTKDYKNAGGFNGVPDSLLAKYSHLSEMEFDEAFKQETKKFLSENPDLYLKGLPFRMMKFAGRQDWTIGYFFSYTDYPNARVLEGFFQTVENFFYWMIIFFPLMYLIRNRNLPSLSVFILWSYLAYSMILLPVTETRSRYNFPYVLFPAFAVAIAGNNSLKKESNS